MGVCCFVLEGFSSLGTFCLVFLPCAVTARAKKYLVNDYCCI